MPSLSFRRAAPADIDGLVDLEVHAFDSDRLSRRSIARLIGARSAVFRIAARDGEIAGSFLLLFRKGSRVARLYSIAVATGHRGTGLSGMLMRDAEEAAGRRGAEVVRLEVREDNRRAVRLYERLGFALIGRRRNYYADGADALRYEKPLAAGRHKAAAESDEDRSRRDSRQRSSYIRGRPSSDLAARRRAEIASPPSMTPFPLNAHDHHFRASAGRLAWHRGGEL